MAPRTSDIYIDSNGNKIVEPMFDGSGGVGGLVGVMHLNTP